MSTQACSTRQSERHDWRRRVRGHSVPDEPEVRPRYPRWLVRGAVERRRFDDPEVPSLMARGEPIVLTGGCPLISELVDRWDFEYLASVLGPQRCMPVHHASADSNVFTRHYGCGMGKGAVVAMSFAEFAQKADVHLTGDATSRAAYYLQCPLVWQEEGGHRKAPFGPLMEDDMSRRVGWSWLRSASEAAGEVPFDTCQLWAGHGGGVTPTHFDMRANFLCQLRGRKQLLLLPPSESFKLYPFPSGHPMDNFAMADLGAPDTARFPALALARGLETTLAPGEVLWLPRCWWHFVHQLEPRAQNLSLNFWTGPHHREEWTRLVQRETTTPDASAAPSSELGDPPTLPASVDPQAAVDAMLEDGRTALICLQAYRVIESAAKSVCGGDAAKAGEFLTALGCGADARWPDAAPSRKLARKLRSELAALLGGSAPRVRAALLLYAMTRDGRLHPGLAPPLGVDGMVVSSDGHGASTTPPEELERVLASFVSAGAATAVKAVAASD